MRVAGFTLVFSVLVACSGAPDPAQLALEGAWTTEPADLAYTGAEPRVTRVGLELRLAASEGTLLPWFSSADREHAQAPGQTGSFTWKLQGDALTLDFKDEVGSRCSGRVAAGKIEFVPAECPFLANFVAVPKVTFVRAGS